MPLTHTKLLAGQSKEGAAGKLKDRYYAFEYTRNEPPQDEGVFYCDYYCVEHFLELLKMAPLPLFNPLKETKGNQQASEQHRRAENTPSKAKTPHLRDLGIHSIKKCMTRYISSALLGIHHRDTAYPQSLTT